MAQERDWMYQRLDKNTGEIAWQFWKGLKHFLEVAFRDAESKGFDTMKCPCKKCKNRYYYDKVTVGNHLCEYGFKSDYYLWDCHGEDVRINPRLYGGFNRINEASSSSNAGASTEKESINNYQGWNVQQMVREGLGIRSSSFEHENDENDPNDFYMDDVDEHEDDMQVETPNEEAQKFFDLLQVASQPLYDGARTEHKKLSVLTKFLSLKSQHNISDAVFSKVIKYINEILPGENSLPTSTAEAKKMIRDLGLPYLKIHACENNCVLFYGSFNSLLECPMCGVDRYIRRGTDRRGKEKLKPKKVLRYLPITKRLKRLYQSSKTAEFMSYHVRAKTNANGTVGHPCQSPAWKHVDTLYPDFSEEVGNVRLGLCTDGFNPMSDTGNPYSIWPVFITVYNMPPDLCMKQPYIFMALLIPGPRSPGRNIDVFLRPLIDELKSLWTTGVQTWDAHRRRNFRMRACLLWTISDFPAYGMLSGWSTHGKLACPYCMSDVQSFQLTYGRKACWWGCHRRFLHHRHPFRNNIQAWGNRERGYPIVYKSGVDILREIDQIQFPPFGSYWDKQRPDGFGVTHNWIKKSIFWELEYWPHLLVRHNLDVMHIEKNCFDNIFYTIMNQKGKSKDNVNSRRDLQVLNIRPELHPFPGRDGRPCQPKAIYTLKQEEIANVCSWLKYSLKLPDGYASNIGSCVNTFNNSFYGMKTHDCHVFMQKLLPIVLRGHVPDDIWIPIVEFCKFFRIICAKEFRFEDVKNLDEFIAVTLCKLEKIFPPSFFDSMEHLTVHLAYQLKICGCVQFLWMYPFERNMKTPKQKCTNKQFKEGSIIEKYLVQEVAFFSEHYMDDNLGTRVNPQIRNEVYSAAFYENGLSIFNHPVKNFEALRNRELTDRELHHVHQYVLQNCPEVEPYISQFNEVSYSLYPTLATNGLDEYRLANFAKWFKDLAQTNQCSFPPSLYDLACFPNLTAKLFGGSYVNGFRFHTKDYGKDKTTANWGVCVFGDANEEDYVDYYGWIDEILMLRYNRTNLTVFKGTWFDPYKGVSIDKHSGIIDVDHTSRLKVYDPFILASQAQQVVYIEYPSKHRDLKKRWTVFKMKPRHFTGEGRRGSATSSSSTNNTQQRIDDDPLQEPRIEETIVVTDNDVTISLVDSHAQPEHLEYDNIIEDEHNDD